MIEIARQFDEFTQIQSDKLALDVVRALLTEPTHREYVLGLRDDPGQRAQVLRLARLDTRRAVLQGDDWTGRAVSWVTDIEATWAESAEFFSKVCRRAHYLENAAGPYLRGDDIVTGKLSTVDGRAWLHLYLTSLRNELRCGRLEDVVSRLLAGDQSVDPYTHALYAYALIVQNKPQGDTEIDAVLALAGDDPSVLHALTEALRYATPPTSRHADRMLALLDRKAVGGRPDATILFRRAVALRRLGRYAEALEAVDASLSRLAPNEIERWTARMSERHRILEEQQLTLRIRSEFAAAHEAARTHLEQTTRDTVGQVRAQGTDNLFRIVEILGVFTAVIALVVGGVASIGMAGIAWWQRAVLLLVFGAVSVGFFVCLRLIVHQRR